MMDSENNTMWKEFVMGFIFAAFLVFLWVLMVPYRNGGMVMDTRRFAASGILDIQFSSMYTVSTTMWPNGVRPVAYKVFTSDGIVVGGTLTGKANEIVFPVVRLPE